MVGMVGLSVTLPSEKGCIAMHVPAAVEPGHKRASHRPDKEGACQPTSHAATPSILGPTRCTLLGSFGPPYLPPPPAPPPTPPPSGASDAGDVGVTCGGC